jgi:hypothetical protein
MALQATSKIPLAPIGAGRRIVLLAVVTNGVNNFPANDFLDHYLAILDNAINLIASCARAYWAAAII